MVKCKSLLLCTFDCPDGDMLTMAAPLLLQCQRMKTTKTPSMTCSDIELAQICLTVDVASSTFLQLLQVVYIYDTADAWLSLPSLHVLPAFAWLQWQHQFKSSHWISLVTRVLHKTERTANAHHYRKQQKIWKDNFILRSGVCVCVCVCVLEGWGWGGASPKRFLMVLLLYHQSSFSAVSLDSNNVVLLQWCM